MPAVLTQKLWQVQNPDPALQVNLSNALNLHPLIAQILINRGICSIDQANEFLKSGLDNTWDPFLLKDMALVVDRLHLALKNQERVLIYGDYDVDGVTSTALLNHVLTDFGLKVTNFIPHRMADGYGLNSSVSELAKHASASLVIAVDCGITAHRQVEQLNENHIDVIIIDHHEPPAEGLPKALAVIDPKRRDCPYPFKHLASVGLVAKLAQALTGEVPNEHLDLIALGTIADVVPLKGENRIFVKYGLPKISTTKNPGLAALIDVAQIRGKKFRPYFVGFILGPRINATGRMDSAQKSLELLLTREWPVAQRLAQELEEINALRQRLQKDVLEEAVQMVEEQVNFNEHKIIVLCHDGWHRGVLGIVASRITELYCRPTIIISLDQGLGTGSARSIEGFHLHEALSHCSELLEAFGGHKLAAGLTIRENNVEEFKSKLNRFAQETLQVQQMVPSLQIDAQVPLSALSMEVAKFIETLEPYGEGNTAPVFCSRQLVIKSSPQVLGRDTIKFWVSDGAVTISALGFGMAKYKEYLNINQTIDLAYELTIDDWNKSPTIQLKLKDIRHPSA